jgi:hypothetical protein
VIQKKGPDNYEELDPITTARGARTSWFSPELREYYVAAPRRDGNEARMLIFEAADSPN